MYGFIRGHEGPPGIEPDRAASFAPTAYYPAFAIFLCILLPTQGKIVPCIMELVQWLLMRAYFIHHLA
jgi:hypothetical protein